VLATRFGVFATEMVHRGECREDGGAAGNRIVRRPPRGGDLEAQELDMDIYGIAREFFG